MSNFENFSSSDSQIDYETIDYYEKRIEEFLLGDTSGENISNEKIIMYRHRFRNIVDLPILVQKIKSTSDVEFERLVALFQVLTEKFPDYREGTFIKVDYTILDTK